MSDLSPFVLEPILVEKPWGGPRFGGTGTLIGESWEVADLPPDSVASSTATRTPVATGPLAGTTLRRLIDRFGIRLMGAAQPTEAGDFPLLVKLLDARQHLSIQVHPTRDYVARHPNTSLKTESWYIVEADPGAVIYKGLRPDVTLPDVQRAAGTAEMVELIQPVEAVPGSFHHLPAGTIHALGAGVLVAEVQTPSDTTFRLYDWTREYGREPRRLHLTAAIETLDLAPDDLAEIAAVDGDVDRQLIETGHYWIRERQVSGDRFVLSGGEALRVLMVLRGGAAVAGPDGSRIDAPAGTTVLVPASVAQETVVDVAQWCVLLEIGLGEPQA